MTVVDDKKLCGDWITAFPLLKRHKNGRKLLRLFDPVIFGIELEKFFSDEYRPKFIALNLLSSFHEFAIGRTLETERDPQLSIAYKHHDTKFMSAVVIMRTAFPILSETSTLTPDSLISLYRQEIRNCLKVSSSPLGVWFSLIQILGYFGHGEIQRAETEEMLKYVGTIPPASLALFGDFDQFVRNELEVSRSVLEDRRGKNLSKGVGLLFAP